MGCTRSKVKVEMAKQEIHIKCLIKQNERIQNDLIVMQNETLKYLQDQTSNLSIEQLKLLLDKKINNMESNIIKIYQQLLISNFEQQNNMSLFTRNTQEHKDNMIRLLQDIHDLTDIHRFRSSQCSIDHDNNLTENVQVNQVYQTNVLQVNKQLQ